VRVGQHLATGQAQEQRPGVAQPLHQLQPFGERQLGLRGAARLGRLRATPSVVAVEVVAMLAADVAVERQLHRDVERDEALEGRALHAAQQLER
jgi:hypothetical protein